MSVIQKFLFTVFCIICGYSHLKAEAINSIVLTGNNGETIHIPIENNIIQFIDNNIVFSPEIDSQYQIEYSLDTFSLISFSNQEFNEASMIIKETEQLNYQPFSNQVILNCYAPQEYQLMIFSIDGKLIHQSVFDNEGKVHIPQLSNGIYIAIAKTNSDIKKAKINVNN